MRVPRAVCASTRSSLLFGSEDRAIGGGCKVWRHRPHRRERVYLGNDHRSSTITVILFGISTRATAHRECTDMITELSLSHYRSISEISIRFGRTNLLVGKNGSGKSNILDSLQFLSDVSNDDLDYAITKRHGSDSIRQWSKYRPFHTQISVKMANNQGHGNYKITIASSRNSYRIIEEQGEWHGQNYMSSENHFNSYFARDGDAIHVSTDDPNHSPETVHLSPIDSFLTYITKNTFTVSQILFDGISEELTEYATYSIFPNTIRTPQAVSSGNTLDPDGKNIASILKLMTREGRRGRERLLTSLKKTLPIVNALTIKSTAGFYVPVLTVTDVSGEQHELNMSQISDGTLRVLGMLTAFYQPHTPSKIAIEEPEQMIHPALLIVLRDACSDYITTKSNGQIFLTTHSPYLVDLFDPEEVISVEFEKGSTKAGPVSDRQIRAVKSGLLSLGEIMLSEGLEGA